MKDRWFGDDLRMPERSAGLVDKPCNKEALIDLLQGGHDVDVNEICQMYESLIKAIRGSWKMAILNAAAS